MLIVLARHGDNGYITSGTVDTGLQTSKTTVKATSKLSKTALADYYNNNPLSDQRVNVFVLCNYTDELLASFQGTGDTGGFGLGDTSWIDKICEVSEADGKNTAIWSRGTMLMTNAAIATKMLPRTLKEWDVYSSASVPLDLSINSSTSSGDRLENNGAVRVERSVARFDFRDGSPLGDNTYHVVATTLPGETTSTDIVDIKLNRMALVNMSNKFYYFRRVTAAGTVPGGVCLPELPWGTTQGNYVVDVDYATKEPGAGRLQFPVVPCGQREQRRYHRRSSPRAMVHVVDSRGAGDGQGERPVYGQLQDLALCDREYGEQHRTHDCGSVDGYRVQGQDGAHRRCPHVDPTSI